MARPRPSPEPGHASGGMLWAYLVVTFILVLAAVAFATARTSSASVVG
uniref:Predicted protein n=1 Tax=Hordeum vulgare subsp. vulgare TaxID=112509 RepID=F2CYG2_HORVV|nr:predicted protein [Hordeum vulgare subsp. vulgare]